MLETSDFVVQEVLVSQNYAKLSGQTGTGRWKGGPKRDGDFRHGIPFTPIGNCLSPSMMPASTFGAGLWLGAVLAEVYYSAGWVAVPFVNMSGWETAIQNYSTALWKFEPHRLARFGNTRLSVNLTPPVSSLRARAWFDADANAAYVVVVNAGGTGANFTATVKQLFNPRMVYRAVNGSVGASEATVLRVPGCRVHYRPVQTAAGPWDDDVSTHSTDQYEFRPTPRSDTSCFLLLLPLTLLLCLVVLVSQLVDPGCVI